MPEPKNPPSPPEQHRASAPKSIKCAVLTVSDTRTEETDKSGRIIMDALKAEGHEVSAYRIVRDEPDEIRRAIEAAAGDPDIQAILIDGGTGLSPRDGTHEVVSSLLEKRMDGFGELFRMLSHEEIGAASMLSRAVAGSYRGTIVFSMPGSSGAVRLAMHKLILPELGHIVQQISL